MTPWNFTNSSITYFVLSRKNEYKLQRSNKVPVAASLTDNASY